MEIIIADNHDLYLDNVTPEMDDKFWSHFSAKHPNSRYVQVSGTGWDGYIRKYNRAKQRMPRAFLTELVEVCEKSGYPYTISDVRQPCKYPIPDRSNIDANMIGGITLHDHQVRSLHACLDHEIGAHSHSTGSGKTEIIAGIIQLFRWPTLVVSDQRIVIEQITERLKLRSAVEDHEIGVYYGGSKASMTDLVVIGSIQSLMSPPTSMKKKKPDEYKTRLERAKTFQKIASKCEMLLVDEVDKASSKQYEKLYRKFFKGRRIYGFSGSLNDPDKKVDNLIVQSHTGPIIAESTRKEIEDIGQIVPVEVYFIAMNEDGKRTDNTAYDIAEKENVIENTNFYAKVKRIVDGLGDEQSLIIVDTHNVEILGKALESEIDNSKFIYGKTSQKARREALKAYEDGSLKCLIGGKILKRGLDLKGGTSNMIICGGGKLVSNFDQIIGRAVRKNSRGFARVFVFFHMNNKYLYTHSKKQLKAVIDMGYKTKMIFKNAQIPGEQFLKNYRVPKG